MLNAIKNNLVLTLHPTTLIFWAIGSVLVAFAGPFGTFLVADFALRLIFWASTIWVSLAIALSLKAILHHLFPRMNAVAFELLVLSGMTLLFTAFVVWWARLILPLRAPETLSFQTVAFYIFSVSAVVSIMKIAWSKLIIPNYQTANEPDASEPRLAMRLPKEADGPILRVSSSDHFVDVVTPKSVTRLRMRFSDAVAELDDLEGDIVHRSHWVARQAVATTDRSKDRIQLKLVNGDTVPVSRSHMSKVERFETV